VVGRHLLDRRDCDGGRDDLLLERCGNLTHDGRINSQPSHHEEVIPASKSGLYLPLVILRRAILLALGSLGRARFAGSLRSREECEQLCLDRLYVDGGPSLLSSR
jgi:hypothetical protein